MRPIACSSPLNGRSDLATVFSMCCGKPDLAWTFKETFMKRILSSIVIVALLGSATAVSAQSAGTSTSRSVDYWLRYTGKLPIGSTIRVRTSDGKRMTAVLAVVDESGITVEPKTRVPESPRHISFEQLEQIELK